MRHKIIWVLIILVVILCVATGVHAMSSSGYELYWFTPLTGGGGAASSTHYSAHVTLGQSVIGSASSASYEVGVGFWHGLLLKWVVFLPTIFK